MFNRQWLMARSPSGALTPDIFEWREAPIPTPAAGEVLVRTRLLSLDPANRAWMNGPTYREQVHPGDVMHGFTLSEVVESKASGFAPGDLVDCMGGWQDYTVMPAHSLTKRDNHHDPLLLIGVLGVTGLTAYHGLFDIGRPRPGDVVLVSAAAGAVGSIVGQLARIAGCRVVGIAGGAQKCDWLIHELGYDAAVDYKADDFRQALRDATPNGVDIYFDNVGGAILDAALLAMNQRGRIVCCGAVSGYDRRGPAQNSLLLPGIVVTKRLRMEGFIVLDYSEAEAEARLADWVANGRLKPVVDLIEGLERAPDGLISLLAGGNRGKLAVRVA
jgi:NADPH-dependent curcumin reductase CurA